MNAPINPDAYYTAREAAEVLRCHEKTVRRMLGAGEIRGVMVAGRWLIDPIDLPTTARLRPPPPIRRPSQAPGRLTALARQMGDNDS